MNKPDVKMTFERDGFVVVRNLLPSWMAEAFKTLLSKEVPQDLKKWTLPDGLTQTPAFWPLIFNTQLRETMSKVLGPNVRFLQHNDLHVGFSSFTWHRDSVNRKFGVGEDWEESTERYRLARVGIYLQEAESGFRLGLIKGSHRPDKWLSDKEQRLLKRRTSGWANVLSVASGRDLLSDRAEWVSTQPGDAIIFDPRILHTGSEFSGRKYSIFLAFGQENGHFHRHYNYYRHLRKDLNYRALPEKLEQQLRDANLLPKQVPTTAAPIKGAWLPSSLFTAIAKQFK